MRKSKIYHAKSGQPLSAIGLFSAVYRSIFVSASHTKLLFLPPRRTFHTNESKSTSVSLESNRTNRILYAMDFFFFHPLVVSTPKNRNEFFLTKICYKPMQMNQPKSLSFPHAFRFDKLLFDPFFNRHN